MIPFPPAPLTFGETQDMALTKKAIASTVFFLYVSCLLYLSNIYNLVNFRCNILLKYYLIKIEKCLFGFSVKFNGNFLINIFTKTSIVLPSKKSMNFCRTQQVDFIFE